MVQKEVVDSWQDQYSMLSGEERNDPFSAMVPLVLDTELMNGQSRLMLVYATANLEHVKKKDYSHSDWYPLVRRVLKCWLVAYDIVSWADKGKLAFISKPNSFQSSDVFVIEAFRNLVILKPESKEDPISDLLSACANETLFSIRENIWQAFTDVMTSSYTTGDTVHQRTIWIRLFKKSIRLWELCYRLRELILSRAINYSLKG